MLNRSTVADLIEESMPSPEPHTRHEPLRLRPSRTDKTRPNGYESVQQTLQDIQRSVAALVGASQAFILTCREDSALEIASTHNIRVTQAMDLALSQATLPLHAALRGKMLVTGDLNGYAPATLPGNHSSLIPAALCVPLDLGPRMKGALCLLRRGQPQHMSDLDLEIVQALAEQAALAICAASHSNALSRLQDSLSTLAPAYA